MGGQRSTAVEHLPARSRFEKGAAYLSYEQKNRTLVIHRTIVPSSVGGRGAGAALVRAAAAYARQEGLDVGSTCWFASAWLGRHPELGATRMRR